MLKAALGTLVASVFALTSASVAFSQTTGAGAQNTGSATGTQVNAQTAAGTPVFSPTAEQFFLLTSNGLTEGSTGMEVVVLQGFLAELGFLDLSGIGGPTGYFGPMTAIGVPSTGYFGPMTRTAMGLHFVRNNWMNNLSSLNGGANMSASASAGANTGGAEVDFGTGIFSATNPGFYFNNIWYPNPVDMSIRASGAAESSANVSGAGTTDTGGSGNMDTNTDTSGTNNGSGVTY